MALINVEQTEIRPPSWLCVLSENLVHLVVFLNNTNLHELKRIARIEKQTVFRVGGTSSAEQRSANERRILLLKRIIVMVNY